MLVLRLLVMVLTIICLMDGHAEVSSSTSGIRDRRESPAVKTNDSEVDVLERKKKKKPKPSKKKKPKPGKKKPKPNKAKPKPTKPVTTTTTMPTSTLKTTTTLTTPTITTTATTTTTTVSPTTTETTVKTITSTTSTTATLSTTTATTTLTTTAATSSTASTTTTTIPTTATTSSQPITAATTADSGAGGECKATNGKPCIFPYKDGNEEYNECKNEGGKYFWCATSVYDSGKYKHWSYCPEDRSCPLEGDGECRATNNKPCVFPFKDGNKEYNECADHSGQYFWCATGTNSAGKYTAWSKCPKDGSCPLPQKTTTPAMTPAATAATTTLLTTGTSTAPDEIENKVVSSLKDLVKEESKDGTLEMLEAMNKITQTIIEDLKVQSEDNDPKNIASNHTLEGGNPRSQELSLRYKQGVKSGEITEFHKNFEFVQNTVSWRGSISPVSDALGCCSECSRWSDSVFFDYSHYFGKCYCYKKLATTTKPLIRENNRYSAGVCGINTCSIPLTPPSKDACPPGYENIIDGFPEEPDSSQVISRESINSKEKCKEACDDRQENCLGFYFNTCDKENIPNRCLLLNLDTVDVTLDKNNNVFCKRVPQGEFDTCQCSQESPQCDRCHISGFCANKAIKFENGEICYIEKQHNRDDYIPCGLSVAIKASMMCEDEDYQTNGGDTRAGKKRSRFEVAREKVRKAAGNAFGSVVNAANGAYISTISIIRFFFGAQNQLPPPPPPELKIYTVPVGQGDSTILKCPNGDLTILDIGADGSSGLSKQEYIDMLAGKEDKIKYIFLTHPDGDHVNYLKTVMEQLKTNNINIQIKLYIGGTLADLNKAIDKTTTNYIETQGFYEVYEVISSSNTLNCGHYDAAGTNFLTCGFEQVYPVPTTVVTPSNEVNICNEFQLTLMAANYYEFKHHSRASTNPKNMNSLVMKVTPISQSRPSFLFMGDFESKDDGSEAKMAKFYNTLIKAHTNYYTTLTGNTLETGLQADVVMVPHHGSYTNGNGKLTFLQYISPMVAIFSGDPFYTHGHPRCEILENLVQIPNIKTNIISSFPVPTNIEWFTCRRGKNKPREWIMTSSQDGPNHIFQTIKSIHPNGVEYPQKYFIVTTMRASGITSAEYKDVQHPSFAYGTVLN